MAQSVAQRIPVPHQIDWSEPVPDPYRIFFPLGVLAGLTGVSLWPIYALGWIETFQSAWHIDLMLQGFLLAFVLGFLLTALPRFSLTWHATAKELTTFVFVFLTGNLGTLFGHFFIGRIGFLACLLLIAVFLTRRLPKRKAEPPAEFVFVFAGLAAGILAGVFQVVGTSFEELAKFTILGRRLMSEGMMVLLILGIGGKLMPLFFGFAAGKPLPASIGTPQKFARRHGFYALLALCYLGSYLLEFKEWISAAFYVRATVASILAFGIIGIYKKPRTSGVLVWFLWISCWLVVLSLWGAAIHPAYRVPVVHVMFVGGFGVMILCIATRVTLSHGGWPLEWERRSTALAVGAILFLIALAFRIWAPFQPLYYFQLLGCAGTCWIFGLSIWGVVFTRRALFRRVPNDESRHHHPDGC